jgi:hypothetical protein
MGFFDAFSVLLAGGFLVTAFLRREVVQTAAFRTALMLFVVALILTYLVSGIFMAGPYMSIVMWPIGFVLALLSFRALCLAVAASGSPNRTSDVDYR